MDYIDQQIESLRTECEKLGFQPSYLSSSDPVWEPDYLVLEPGLSICIDPMSETAFVSYWSQEHGRYHVGASCPLVRPDWIMEDLNRVFKDYLRQEEGAAA